MQRDELYRELVARTTYIATGVAIGAAFMGASCPADVVETIRMGSWVAGNTACPSHIFESARNADTYFST